VFKKGSKKKKITNVEVEETFSFDLEPFAARYSLSDVLYDPGVCVKTKKKKKNTRPSLFCLLGILYIYHWFKTPIGYYTRRNPFDCLFPSLLYKAIRRIAFSDGKVCNKRSYMCCSTWQSTFTQTQLSFKEKKKGIFILETGIFFPSSNNFCSPSNIWNNPSRKKMDDRKMM
jgi:hypothetical protein